MRQIHRHTRKLSAVVIAMSAAVLPASAQDSTTYSRGFSLPGVTLPQGHDEVRAADGTSCRSAVGGSGAYLDIGIIGNPNDLGASQSAYGRIVIPLGLKRRNRLDCSKLYDLEVQRLQTELQLMQMGLDRGVETPSSDELASSDSVFNDDGWGTEGLNEN